MSAIALEDVFVIDGMIVSTRGGKARMARGFTVSLPGLENADTASLNTIEDALRAVLRAQPPHGTVQVRWQIDRHAYLDPLLAYHRVTETEACHEWAERQRNRNFIDQHACHERGELRHATMEVFLSLDVNLSRNGDTETAQKGAKPAFDQFQRVWANLAERFGGNVEAIEDEGLFLSCARFLNPTQSFAEGGLDIFDDLLSVGENCLLGEGVPLTKPDQGIYLNGAYWSALVMRRLPKATFMGMILQLTNLDAGDIGVVVNAEVLDVREVIAAKEARTRKLENNFAHNRRPRLHVAIDREHANIHRLMSDEIVPCKAQLIVVIRGKTPEELRANTEMVRNAIFQMHGATPYEVAYPTSVRNYRARDGA